MPVISLDLGGADLAVPKVGMTIRASSPEEFSRYLVSEMQLWGKVVRDARISATP